MEKKNDTETIKTRLDFNGIDIYSDSITENSYGISLTNNDESKVFDFQDFNQELVSKMTFKYLFLRGVLNKKKITFKNLNRVNDGKVLVIDGENTKRKIESVHIYEAKGIILRRLFLITHFCFTTDKDYNKNSLSLETITTISDEESNYKISKSHYNKIKFTNLTNLSNNFILQDLEIDELIIKNSDLGRMKFNGVIIHKLYLENVTLNDCIFNSVEFPSNYELGRNENFDERMTKSFLSHSQLKDNYRQLKFVMDKNGNKTEANKFFGKEMQYYMKSLDIEESGLWNNLKKLFNDAFSGQSTQQIGEKLSLIFGYEISEFGNNWLKTLQMIFLVAIVTTLIIGLSNLGGSKTSNFTGDVIAVVLILVSIIIGYFQIRKKTKIIDSILKKISSNIITLSIILIGGLMFFSIVIDSYSSFSTLFNLLNPFFLKEKGVDYNSIELLGLLVYKTIYGILLYQLVIALKRTTKR